MEKSIHTFFKSEPIDGIFKNYFEISFCAKHNFICTAMPNGDKAHSFYHFCNATDCEKALALVLWSEFKQDAYINTVLKGTKILDFLVEINKIDIELYYLTISKLKEIMEIESDSLGFAIECFETNFNIETVLKYCKEHNDKIVQILGFGKPFYGFIPNNQIDDEFHKKRRQCDNCGIWYLRANDLSNIDERLKFKCINCLEIKNIISDLPEIISVFSSGCINWLNSKIPNVCTNEITAYLFDKEHIKKFPQPNKKHTIKSEYPQTNKKSKT